MPSAAVDVGDSTATLKVDKKVSVVRVKRAQKIANQVQVWRGEPLVVHVPDVEGDRWFVLPVSWQMSFARKNAISARQHASHAFDCMMIRKDDLPESYEVAADKLAKACAKAVREAQSREVRFVIKAIERARGAVANVLIDTLEEEFGLE